MPCKAPVCGEFDAESVNVIVPCPVGLLLRGVSIAV